MTRGNQREIDRQRAANRHKKDGGEARTGDTAARREADAKALQDKIEAKRAREEAIARGEISAEKPRGHGGGAVKSKPKK
eukprot:gene10401-7396_t